MKAATKIFFCVLTVLFFTTIVSAKNFKIPHKFKSGDLISADMINEIFEELETLLSTPSIPDFLGTWQCEKIITSSNCSNASYAYSSVENTNYFCKTILTLEITDNNDGSYSWASTPTNGIIVYGTDTDNCPGSGRFEIFRNKIVMTHSVCDSTSDNPIEVTIQKTSTEQFRMVQSSHPGGSYPTLYCDNQNIPPEKPTKLSKSTSGLTVTLFWTDNSLDETGFKLIRKDHILKNWNEVSTIPADTTSDSDTVPSAGTYWYRVKATNSNGDSFGSNVVKVTIE